MLRLVPVSPGEAPVRIAASELLAGRADDAKLAGAIVFLGGSAPELGALRPSLVDPLTPSTLLHAMAARQIAAGVAPVRPSRAAAIELAAALALVLGASMMAARARPLPMAAIASGAAVLVAFAAAGLSQNDILFDPTAPLAAGAAGYAATSVAQFSKTKRLEARLRRRFEQHLAPDVVERIVADPGQLRMSGELRNITALFTDIEGFTVTTAACVPHELIGVLDGYFAGVASIVTRHGGMIDKFVGDAVHAFFNMPLDLADHAKRAVAAAIEIEAWTESYRLQDLPRRIGLGRTRIGVETGEAVVGDVGLATKLDYTAHGGVVNTAARLEAMNKELGTAICIGPIAASHCAAGSLRGVGERDIRGIGRLALFTPIRPGERA